MAHLCADGAAALVGAGVDVQVEENAGLSHLQVGVGIHSSFQPLEAPKHHESVPAAHRRGSLAAHHGPLNATHRALSAPQPVLLCPRQSGPLLRALPPGWTHLKLGSWAEATSEPRSDVPMVRS